MRGIWISPTEYVEFSELPPKRVLLDEIATRARAMEYSSWFGILPDPDPVLRKTGDGVSVLQDLTADDQVCMAMQSRKLGTLSRDYQLQPGHAKDKEPDARAVSLCDDLERDLEDIDLYNLLSQVLDAPYYGNTIIEIIWAQEGTRLKIADLIPRPRKWFSFDSENRLVFRGEGLVGDEPVPPGKFAVARHFPEYENPYGLRLLSRCLWPVAFKKGGWQFFVTFAERFGTPWTVYEAPVGTTREDRSNMLSDLSAMTQQAVAVVQGGGKMNLIEPTGKSGDVHPELIRMADAAISKVLMGQTLTAEILGQGSRAAAETHREGLIDYRRADATLVETAMNEVAWLYMQVNAPGVWCPTFSFIQDEDYQTDRAERDKTVKECGVSFTKQYFVRHYGYAEDEIEIAEVPAQPTGTHPPQFAEGSRFTPEQEAIEGLVSDVLPQGMDGMQALVGEVRRIIGEAASPEDLERRLAEALPGMLDRRELDEVIARSLLAADLFGRWTISEEARRES